MIDFKQKLLLCFRLTPIFIFSLFLVQTISHAQKEQSGQVLYESGMLQHAAWQYGMEREYDKSNKVYDEIEDLLLVSKVDESETHPENDLRGVAQTFRVFFINTHITALFKEINSDDIGDVKYERAAYQLSRELRFNFVPTVVIRTIEVQGNKFTGSLMYWINDATSASSAGLSDLSKPDLLHFFDAIIGNVDRHLENWMISPRKKLIAVDHNRSFFHEDNSWIPHLQSIRDPKSIRESEQFEKLSQISKPQFDTVLAIISEKARKDAWLVRNKIIYELENSIKKEGTAITSNVMFGFVRYDLDQPILTKNSEVEIILRGIVENHLPYRGLGSRRDGLFSVSIRDKTGTRSALGGLQVYKKDAIRIKQLLIDAGFIIKRHK